MPIRNIKLILRKLFYAILLVRECGPGIVLRQLRLRIYSNTRYVWLAKDLDFEERFHSSLIRFSLRLASPNDFKKILGDLNGENSQDLFEILRRVSFYNRGFDTCYLAFTDSGKVCHMSWLLSANHNDLIRKQYPIGMRELRKNEVLQENVFTFSRYRSKGVMTSVTLALAKIAKKQGFCRVLAYVDLENSNSLRAFHRTGFRSYEEEQEIRRFFRIKRQKLV